MKYKRLSRVISRLLLASQFWFGLHPGVLAAITAGRLVRVQAVRIANEDEALVAVIELDGIAVFTQSTLPNPPRLIVDIKNAVQTMRSFTRTDEQLILNVGAGGIERTRVGQMGNTVRVVFDVAKLGRYSIERQGFHLHIRFPRSATDRRTRNQTWTMAASPAPQPVNPSLTEAAMPAAMTVPLAATAPVKPSPMPELKIEENNVSAREGKKNFLTGMKHEARQQWEQAAQHFLVAVTAEPNNPEYQLHLLRAQQNASLLLAGRGDALAEQSDYTGAYRAYRQAAAYDDTNELVRVKMQRMATQQTQPASSTSAAYNPRTGNYIATGSDLALPDRSQSRDLLHVIHFESVKLRQIIEKFGTDLGLNVLFDESFKDDDKFRFKVQNVTLARALDMILVQTKHLFEQIDRRTILIYADTPANRQRFEQLLVKTFYLGSADPNDVKATIHQMIGPQRQIAVLKQLNALIVRDTIGNLKMIQEIIDSVDKNRAEVVVDVDIYEVSRSTSLEIGNQLALSALPVTEMRFDKNGQPLSVTTGNSASLSNLGGVGRAGIAALAGTTVAPVLGGVGTLLGLPPSSLSLLQSKGSSKLLASTQIHALDGEQNQTKVGRSVPVRIGSTYVPGVSGPQNATSTLFGGAFDSIQYRDVGLVIDVTPTVSNEGYVQLRMRLESTNVEGAEVTLTPSFSQRSLSTIARVVDGKTAVVAGIKQESKGESRGGIPVLSMIPVLGRFITTPRQNSSLSDVLITVTPHILRAPEIKQQDHLAKLSGTFIAGVTQSIEDVATRAQTEDDQERRLTNRQSLIAQGDNTGGAPTAATADNAPLAATAQTASADAASTAAPAVTAALQPQPPAPAPTASQANALVDLSLIPSTIEAASGSSFFVVASVYGQARMSQATLAISFDPVLLRFKSVRSGGLLGRNPALTHEVQDGELQIKLRQIEARESPVAASGQLVLIEFVALNEGETFIEFKREATELWLGRNAVPFNSVNAQVHIGKEATTNSSNK